MTKIKVDPNWRYDSLTRVLHGAYKQASDGKGKERHADGEPFEQQKICVIGRWLKDSPVAGPLQQVVKKTVESSRLPASAAIDELRGAINYLAAAIVLLEEIPEEKAEKEPEEFSQIKLFDHDNRLADPTPKGGRLCVCCEHIQTRVADMPCKKCIQWDFKPHFRLVD